MRNGYSVTTTTAVALTAATAKTVLTIRSGATFGLDLRKVSVAFDGVTASAIPVLVELYYVTFSGLGTNTARTVTQTGGRVIASGMTGASNYTVEPTAITVLKQYLLTPNGGLVIEEFAPDNGWDCGLAEGFGVRCTAPAAVNVVATLDAQKI